MVKFTWVGGPTFLLEVGDLRILTDPVFGEGDLAFIMTDDPATGEALAPVKRHVPFKKVNIEEVDLVLLSHLHSDHFDLAAESQLPQTIPMIVSSYDAPKLKARGYEKVQVLDWWQACPLYKNGAEVTLTAVPARHAHSDHLNRDLGVVNGYWLSCTNRSTPYTHNIYWTGDTVWFEGMRNISHKLGKPDVLVPHMGAEGEAGPLGRLTLNASDTVKMMQWFNPHFLIPIHHHTFSHYVESVEVLFDLLSDLKQRERVVILEEGKSMILSEEGKIQMD
ncbi:MBL fold metallo-hydrolase [Caldalkalibacillus salinus]|uniref:MBL fold metallo-hydrolase n=1 Tax=Caldalkalibacillus salinus TaxID=2803787 RepID=UPI0019248241|nr:MBL fold metallo-hydrolase [Caldalkalibacillus salinus]